MLVSFLFLYKCFKKHHFAVTFKKIEKLYLFLLVLIKIGSMFFYKNSLPDPKDKSIIKGCHFDGHPKTIKGIFKCNNVTLK